MRNQLEVIHVIDKYLRGVLDEAETQVFENRLKTDTQLQQEVAKQQVLMEAIKRSALTASAAKGKKKYKTIKTLKYVGVLVAAVSATTMSVYFVNQNKEEISAVSKTTTQLGMEALPTQGYQLNTAKDTVIETENGSVYVIPADAFETESGEAVTGKVTFEIKEAFEEVDIMKAGLTTTSNGELLETGGMFFLEATQNGQKLRLKNGKEILSQLPNLQPDKDMKLFDGEKQPDGTINWVNPKEFEKDLITVDITSLDFYPEGYVEELSNKKEKVLIKAEGDLPTRKMTIEESRKLGYRYPKDVWNVQDALRLGLIVREYEDEVFDSKVYSKEFTDSLYYSFARLFERNDRLKSETLWALTPYLLEEKDKDKKEKLLSKGFMFNEGTILIKKNDAIKIIGDRKVKRISFFDDLINNPRQYLYPNNGSFNDFIYEFSNVTKIKNAEFLKRSKEKDIHWNVSGERDFIKNDTTILQVVSTDSNGDVIDYGQLDTVISEIQQDTESSLCPIPSGINPAKVKAIWNKKFNKTILATKEFEERMKVIHESHQDRILEVYVTNLDKPLWYSDSIVMITFSATAEKFRAFYNERKGGVKVNDRLANKLTSYFTKKHKEFTSATSEAFEEYERKKQQLRQQFEGKKSNKIAAEVNRQFKVFTEEFETNLCEAYRQLGNRRDCRTRITTKPLTSRIKKLGPKNIDRAVFEATRDRKTLDFTDPVTGKKAVIKYEPLKVKVLNEERFDRIFMYLIPDKLNSFNRMKTQDKKVFDLPINELLNYSVKAIAYEDNNAFYAEINQIKLGEYTLTLSSISETDLKKKLRKVKNTIEKDIKSDLDFYKAEFTNKKGEEKYKEDNALTLRIGRFLFPKLADKCILPTDHFRYGLKFGDFQKIENEYEMYVD